MPCRPFKEERADGTYFVGISCSRGGGGGKRALCDVDGCTIPHTYLCDWPTEEGRTCDFKLCKRHTKQMNADKDYCPNHYVESLK